MSVGFEGIYLAIEPGKRLVFTWSKVIAYATGERESAPDSQVEVTFTAKYHGTHVRLVHSAVPNKGARRGFAGGWESAFRVMSTLFSQAKD